MLLLNKKNIVKYPGAVLDQCMIGDSVANSVLQKTNARLKILYSKQGFLNLHTKRFQLCHYFNVIFTTLALSGILDLLNC